MIYLAAIVVCLQGLTALPVQAAEAWSADRLGGLFDGSAARIRQVNDVSDGQGKKATADPAVASSPANPPEDLRGQGEGRTASPAGALKGDPLAPEADPDAKPPIEEIPQSDWQAVGKISDSISSKNPSAREKEAFWDHLRNSSFWSDIADTLCKEAKIPVSQNLRLGGVASVSPKFERFLRTGLEGRMILVDRARLRLGLGYGYGLPEFVNGVGVSVSVGSELDGYSLVVRPLESKRACNELDSLIDLRTIKSVLPLDADRFAAMKVEELWTIPVIFRANFGVGVGATVSQVPISLSWGYSRQGGSSVSLRRLAEDQLRVRVRIDYARFQGPSAGVVYSIFGEDFQQFRRDGKETAGDLLGNLVGKDVAWGLLDRELRRYFERYMRAHLTWMAQWSKEDHAMIEVMLDPTDKAQMKVLEELLAGGKIDVLDTLVKMSKTASKTFLHLKELREEMGELKKSYEEAFGAAGRNIPVYGATSKILGFLHHIRLKLPVLMDLSYSWGNREERLTIFDETGGEFNIYRAHSESSNGFLDVPFVGRVINYHQRRSVLAFTHEDDKGESTPPAVVYVHQEGYTVQAEEIARNLALTVDGMMRLAGTKGRGENAKSGLPLDRVFPLIPPEPEPEEFRPEFLREARKERASPQYRRGMSAFTLALGEKALNDILDSSTEEVVRSYVRAQAGNPDGPSMRWVVEHGKILPDGRVEYDDRALQEFLGPAEARLDERRGQDGVRMEFDYARRLVVTLRNIRKMRPADSKDPKSAQKQAEAVRNLIAGSLGYGLSYEDIMRILVQLVDPAHLSAEYIVSAQPSEKKNPKVEGRYLFRRGLEEDDALTKLSEATSRVNRPSEYTD